MTQPYIVADNVIADVARHGGLGARGREELRLRLPPAGAVSRL